MSTQLLKNSQRMLRTFENAHRSTTENTIGTRVREARDARVFRELYLNMTAERLKDWQKFFDTTYVFSAVIDRNDEPIDMESMAVYPSDFSFDSVMNIVEHEEAEKTNDVSANTECKVEVPKSTEVEQRDENKEELKTNNIPADSKPEVANVVEQRVETKETVKNNNVSADSSLKVENAIEHKRKVVINVSSTYEISVVPQIDLQDEDIVRQGICNIIKKGIPDMHANQLKSLAEVSGLVRYLKAQNQEYEISFEGEYSKAYFEYMTYGKENEILKYDFYTPRSQPNEILDFDEKLAGMQQLRINIMDYSIWLTSQPYRSFPELDLFYDPGFKNEFCNIIMSGKTNWRCCYLKPMAAAMLVAKKCKKLNINYHITCNNWYTEKEFEKIRKELL